MARFNHIELTVPKGMLDIEGKKKIVGFYRELFGWSEATIESSSKNTELSGTQRMLIERLSQPGYLILRCSPGMPDQSLILSEAEKPLDPGVGGIPPHAGLLLDSFDEVREVYAKAKEFQKNDPDVELLNETNINDPNFDGPNLGFYLRYKSPLWWDVQYLDRTRMPVVVDD
jgi:hypothetical protein